MKYIDNTSGLGNKLGVLPKNAIPYSLNSIRRYKNHEIPEPMKKHGDKVLPWNLEVLQSELDKIMKEKEESNNLEGRN